MSKPRGNSFTGDVTSTMSSRRKARKRALDVLYEADVRQAPITDVLDAYLERLPEPKPEQLDYTVALANGVAGQRDRVDELIASYAEGWTLDRMPTVDRNLARIAVYELIFRDEIDDAVAITEAVELAKALSTEDSPRFLNGVLGRIAEYANR